MGAIGGIIIFVWAMIGLVKYANKHSLLRWKQYEFYKNGDLKSMSNLKFLGTGYKYTYREDGSLLKKQYMHHRKEIKDEYELYYPSGKLKIKSIYRS